MKTIAVEDKIWKKLMTMKLKDNCSSLSVVIEIILNKHQTLIKENKN